MLADLSDGDGDTAQLCKTWRDGAAPTSSPYRPTLDRSTQLQRHALADATQKLVGNGPGV